MSDELARPSRGIVEALDLPAFLPGDTPDEHSVHGGYYDIDGHLVDPDPMAAGRAMTNWELRRDQHFVTDLTAPTGISVSISTVWLAMNHCWTGGRPLVWETMLQADGDWGDFQVRYCTRNAARAGHLKLANLFLAAGLTVVTSNLELES